MPVPTFVTHYMVRRPKSADRTHAGQPDSVHAFENRQARKIRGMPDSRQNASQSTQSPMLRRAG